MKKVVFGILGGVGIVILIALARTFMAAGPAEPMGSPQASAAAQPYLANSPSAGEVAAHLSQAVRFKTISFQNPAEADPAPFIGFRAWLEATYPAFVQKATREIVGGHSLLYSWPGRNAALPPVLLMAHQDVVPIAPGTEDLWEHAPFSGEIADGFVWGRGTIDDKGSLVTLLEAANHLAASGFVPERTLMFALGHDEEIGGGQGSARIAALLAERGVRLAWVVDEGGIVAQGLVPGVEGPVALIGIAEKGYVSLTLTTQAKGGHSSMPPKETAIGQLAAAIDALVHTPFESQLDGPTGQMLDALTPAMSFGGRLALANRWLFGPFVSRGLEGSPTTAAQLHTTIAPTLLEAGVKENVLPTQASATVNFRVHPRDTIADVVAHTEAAVAPFGVAVTVTNPGREASPVSSTAAESFQILADTVRTAFEGTVVAPNLVVGGTDSRHFTDIADNIYRFMPIRLGPEDTARFHGTSERVSVQNVKEATDFYIQLLVRAGEPPAAP